MSQYKVPETETEYQVTESKVGAHECGVHVIPMWYACMGYYMLYMWYALARYPGGVHVITLWYVRMRCYIYVVFA